MMFLFGASWCLFAALSIPPLPPLEWSQRGVNSPTIITTTTTTAFVRQPATTTAISGFLNDRALLHLADSAAAAAAAGASVAEPSEADITLLRRAFAEFYDAKNRDLVQSELLLSQTIQRWQELRQPNDEVAGLLRVRGDCLVLLGNANKALSDYSLAIQLLSSATTTNADPAELPAALLGRARALKSLGPGKITSTQAAQAAADYKQALILTSREEWDTEQELLEDGASRNPYAAWEMGEVLSWSTNKNAQALAAHQLAADAFANVGDKARSVISEVDAGIDMAAAAAVNGNKNINNEAAIVALQRAIDKTKGVESRDVALLQRVLAKEGEGRMALAALLWESGQGGEAETVLNTACTRLEQMQVADAVKQKMDATKSISSTTMAGAPLQLRFSIDDLPSLEVSCYKFRDASFLTDRLGWPESLQKKVLRLEMLR